MKNDPGGLGYVNKVCSHVDKYRKKYLVAHTALLSVVAILFSFVFGYISPNSVSALEGDLTVVQTIPALDPADLDFDPTEPIMFAFNASLLDTSITVGEGGFDESNSSNAPRNITVSDGIVDITTGTISYNDEMDPPYRVYIFTPSSALEAETDYTFTITGGVDGVSSAGPNYLAEDYVVNFTTGIGPPSVFSVSPVDLGTDVNFGPETDITAIFDRSINTDTLTASTFTLVKNVGSVPITPDSITFSQNNYPNDKAVFTVGLDDAGTPEVLEGLEANTGYTATIKGVNDDGLLQVEDTLGNQLQDNYIWTFTTATNELNDTAPPSVMAKSPDEGAVNVALDSNVVVRFTDEFDIKESTVNGTTFTLTKTVDFIQESVAGVVSYEPAEGGAIFNPVDNLEIGGEYTATLSGIKDDVGNLMGDYSWTFYGDNVPPTVTSYSPQSGGNNPSLDPPTSISFVFSEDMDTNTIDSASVVVTHLPSMEVISSGSVGCGIDYACSITFMEGSPFVAGETYRVEIGVDPLETVSDQAGNVLLDELLNPGFTWEFTVTDPNGAPIIDAVSPTDESPGVNFGPETDIVVTFNKSINPATLNGSFTLVPEGGVPIDASYITITTRASTYEDDQAVFTVGLDDAGTAELVEGLAGTTSYTATITTGVTDTNDTPIAAPYPWTFGTQIDPDTTPPTVDVFMSMPSSGEENVDVIMTSSVRAVFSESLKGSTVVFPGSFILTKIVDEAPVSVPGTVSYDSVSSNIAVFSPTDSLESGTEYTATLSGIQDAVGNVMVGVQSWSFITEQGWSVSSDPVNGAEAVPLSSNVELTFTTDGQLMNDGTIDGTNISLFSTRQGALPVSVLHTDGTLTATIDPNSDFLAGDHIYITIDTGVLDANGTALAEDVTYEFYTASDITLPTVVDVSPAAAIDDSPIVPLDTDITVTFSEPMGTISTDQFYVTRYGGARISTPIASISEPSGPSDLTRTLSFTEPLLGGERYTVTVLGGVMDGVQDSSESGNRMAETYTWDFYTVPDTVSPTVSSYSPQSGGTNPSLTNPTSISISFNEEMNTSTLISDNITVTKSDLSTVEFCPQAGNLTSWNIDICPSPYDWEEGETYTVTLASSITDSSENPLVDADGLPGFSWSFTIADPINGPPIIDEVYPLDDAPMARFGPETDIVATFNKSINQATLDASTFTLVKTTGGASVPSITDGITTRTSTYTNDQAVFTVGLDDAETPGIEGLAASTNYTATIRGFDTGFPYVEDTLVSANALEETYVWTFTTASMADTTSPTITTYSPESGGDNPSLNVDIPFVISANFNDTMDESTIIPANISITNILTPGVPIEVVDLSCGSTSCTISYNADPPFVVGETYEVVFNGSITDIAGNPLVDAEQNPGFSWQFTITDPSGPPVVDEVYPANLASGVSFGPETDITVTFNKSMTPATLTTSTFKVAPTADLESPLASSIAISTENVANDQAVLTVLGLQASTPYRATITTGVTDAESTPQPIAAEYYWTFTTSNSEDVTPPTVNFKTPAAGATSVVVETSVVAIFNEVLKESTVNTGTFTLTGPSGLVSGTVSYDSMTGASFVPDAPLSPSSLYTAALTTGIKDIFGNSMAEPGVSWTFTTIADSTPPSISSRSPGINASGVSRSADVEVVFSEPIDPETINATTFTVAPFENSPGASVSSGGISYDEGTRTATFLAPVGGYLPDQQYIVSLNGGMPGGIEDLNGVAFNSTFWYFTTLDDVGPTVSSVSPAIDATGVPVDTQISVTFDETMAAITAEQFFVTRDDVEPSELVQDATNIVTDGSTVTLTLNSNLAYGAHYTVTVIGDRNELDVDESVTGVQDAIGNQMAVTETWSFSTANISFLSDPNSGFFPEINGPVYSSVVGDVIVAGGDFSLVDGGSQNGLVSFDAAGGSATVVPSWNPLDAGAVVNSVYLYESSELDGEGNPTTVTLYVGGNFTIGGIETPTHTNLAAFDMLNSGALLDWDPGVIDGPVKVIVSAGGGGIFIGGAFDSIDDGLGGTYLCSNFAYIGSDESKICLADVVLNEGSSINAIASVNGGVFFGGSFTSIGGVNHAGLAFLDTTGEPFLSAWNPNITGTVNALSVTGSSDVLNNTSNLLVGGSFSSASGTSVGNFVAYDISNINSPTVDPAFAPSFNGTVDVITVANSEFYIGGQFTAVTALDTQYARSGAASFLDTDGSIEAWAPPFSNTTSVKTFYIDDDIILAGGAFSDQNYLALFSTGTDPSVTVSQSTLAVTEGGAEATYSIVLDTEPTANVTINITTDVEDQLTVSPTSLTFTTETWLTPQDVTVTAIEESDIPEEATQLVTISHTVDTGVESDYTGVIIDDVEVTITDVPPLIFEGGEINVMVEDADGTIFVGGSFISIGGVTRNGLASIEDGELTDWDPNLQANGQENIVVHTLSLREGMTSSALYVGGTFTLDDHTNVVAIDISAALPEESDLPLSWNPGAPNAAVRTIALTNPTDDNTDVFFGGDFTTIGGTSCPKLAYADSLGALTCSETFGVSGEGSIYSLYFTGGGEEEDPGLFIGGTFTSVGDLNSEDTPQASARTFLAAYEFPGQDAASAVPNPWDPSLTEVEGGGVYTVAMGDDILYVGGLFSVTDEALQEYTNLVAFNGGSIVSAWQPNPIGAVNTFYGTAGGLYVGGEFTSIAGSARTGLALISTVEVLDIGASVILDDWNPELSPGTVNALHISNADTLFVGGAFTSTSPSDYFTYYTVGAGVTIEETEGGTAVTEVDVAATDSYTVVLDAQPTDDITINISADAQVTVSPPSLTFTTENWNIQQTVTVTAVVDDGVEESTHPGVITHTFAEGTNSGYLGVSIADVVATVTDDPPLVFEGGYVNSIIELDTGVVIVGGSFDTVAGQTRNGIAAIANGELADLDLGLDEGATVYDLDLYQQNGLNEVSTLYVGGDFTIGGAETPTHTNLAAFNFGDGGGGALLPWNPGTPDLAVRTMTLSDPTGPGDTGVYIGGEFTTIQEDGELLPTTCPKLAYIGSDDVLICDPSFGAYEGSVYSLYYTGGLTPGLFIGGTFTSVGDSTSPGDPVARNFLAVYTFGEGAVLNEWAPDLTPGAESSGVYALEMDDQGILYAGGSFSINDDDVDPDTRYHRNLVAFDFGDGGSVVSEWTPNPEGIVKTFSGSDSYLYVGGTFTAMKGYGRTGLARISPVNGVDDAVVSDWIPVLTPGSVNTVLFSAPSIFVGGAFASPDAYFTSYAEADAITATPGVTISDTSLAVTEGGASATYTVRLNSAPGLGTPVTITITNNDTDQFTVDETPLVFTSSDWAATQTVTVTAVNDDTVEDIASGTISHVIAEGSDADYSAVTISDVTVTVTDNDEVVEDVAVPDVYVNSDYSAEADNDGYEWGVTAFDNMDDAILAVDAGGTIHAANNWWNDASGPTISTNPNGQGTAIETGDYTVLYRPFCASADCTTMSTYEVDAADLLSLFSNGGTMTVTLAEGGTDYTEITAITVNENVAVSLSVTGGNTVINIPEGTMITTAGADATFDASLLVFEDQLTSAFSGYGSLDLTTAFEWGIPNLGLEFIDAITIDMYVGEDLDGQTLTLKRATSASSGWTNAGLGGLYGAADGECLVAAGTCSFTTTLASYYIGGTVTASVSSPSGGGGGGSPFRTKKKITIELPKPDTTVPPTMTTPLRDIAGHWAQSYIEDLYLKGIVTGDHEYNYNPNNPITRAEFTKIVVGTYNIPMQDDGSFKSSFKDVDTSKWYASYVQAAYDKGLVEGFEDETFKPDQPITRAEAMKIILSASGATISETTEESIFKDVNKKDWFIKYVDYAAAKGIVSGYGDGTFGPNNPITRAEVAKIASLILSNELITTIMRVLN